MAEKINVVVMAQVQYPQGMAATRRVQNFVEYLALDGRFEVRVLVLRGGRVRLGEDALSGEWRGVPYVTIGADIRPGMGALLKAPRYYLEGAAFLRRHKRAGKNVLYVYDYPSTDNLPMLMQARMAGYRIVFDIVEDIAVQGSAPDVLARVKNRSARVLSRTMWMFADAAAAISSRLMEKMRRASRGRFEVVHCPINVRCEDFDFGPPAFGRPVRVFYGGTFDEKDGVENLIAAFEMVCRDRADVNLVLTGRGGRERMEAVMERIARSECREKILYMGYLAGEDFRRELESADILCVTRTGSAFAEAGFPFKLGEYLATGRPVVASKVGDVGEYLEDRRDAVLVRPDDAGAIADGILWLIGHPDEARATGAAGKAVAAENFDWRVVGEKLKRAILEAE